MHYLGLTHSDGVGLRCDLNFFCSFTASAPLSPGSYTVWKLATFLQNFGTIARLKLSSTV